MPMFPVWMNDGKTPRPDRRVYYEIAANGTFLHKENKFWRAVVPVDSISVLEKCQPNFEALLPIIPAEIVFEITRFFAWITREINTESLVLLWWDEEAKAYSVTVPPQRVSFGRVEHDNPQNRDCMLIGSFHSHGSMSAGHSSVDLADEENFDGIHGTFGSFGYGRNLFDISLQASINNSRFSLHPPDFLEGVREMPKHRASLQDPVSSGNNNIDNKPKNEDNQSNTVLSDPADVWLWRGYRRRNYYLDGADLLPRDYRPRQDWIDAVQPAPHRNFFTLYNK